MATSIIKGGVESFAPTLGSGISGNAYGTYDRKSGIVTVMFRASKDANIAMDDALFTVPSAYRPSTSKGGVGMIINAAGTTSTSSVRVLATGEIQQRSSNTTRQVIGVIQYTL